MSPKLPILLTFVSACASTGEPGPERRADPKDAKAGPVVTQQCKDFAAGAYWGYVLEPL